MHSGLLVSHERLHRRIPAGKNSRCTQRESSTYCWIQGLTRTELQKYLYLLFLQYPQVLLKYRNVTHEVWSQTGNQGNKWRRGEVFLGLGNYFQVCESLFSLGNTFITRFTAKLSFSLISKSAVNDCVCTCIRQQ